MEYLFLADQGRMIQEFANTTLKTMSLEKLVNVGLASRNLKTGLDFSDSYKSRSSRGKFLTYLQGVLVKERPHLFDTNQLTKTFFERFGSEDTVTLNMFYDQSIVRYISRIEHHLNLNRIPVSLRAYPYEHEDLMAVVIRPSGDNTLTSINYYKLLFIVPQCLNFFRCLGRKAKVTNAQTYVRSRRSGFRTGQNRGSAAVNQSQPRGAVQAAANSRRAGTLYR